MSCEVSLLTLDGNDETNQTYLAPLILRKASAFMIPDDIKNTQ